MRKKITLTGYRLRKGRKTKDTAIGSKSFLLDEGRCLVNAAPERERWKVIKENSLTFLQLLALAKFKGYKLTPTYSRA